MFSNSEQIGKLKEEQRNINARLAEIQREFYEVEQALERVDGNNGLADAVYGYIEDLYTDEFRYLEERLGEIDEEIYELSYVNTQVIDGSRLAPSVNQRIEAMEEKIAELGLRTRNIEFQRDYWEKVASILADELDGIQQAPQVGILGNGWMEWAQNQANNCW